MQDFEQFVAKISDTIDRRLPGAAAHKKLQPYYANAKQLNIPANPFAKKSAVMVLLFPKYDKINILYIERPANTGVHSKQISFPGGGKEKNDKNYFDTALRETYEEVGIEPNKIRVLGKLTKLYVAASNYLIQPVVGYLDEAPQYLLNHTEVDAVIELPLDFLAASQIKEKPIRSGLGIVLQAPYYDINNKTLWGATAMITSELVDISSKIIL